MNHEPGVVIIGSGTLALALEKRWLAAGVPVAQAGRKSGRWHADLARAPECWRLPRRPGWVFVCAGVTSRESCERDTWRSRWINVIGGIRVAQHFKNKGARVVFFGTDLSSDHGIYAKQKEELRRAVAGIPNCLWIKLAKVIHPLLPIFQTWRASLIKGGRPKAFENVFLRPISPEAVAECSWRMANNLQISNHEISWQPSFQISYLELANRWLKWIKKSHVIPEPIACPASLNSKTYREPLRYHPFADIIRIVDAKKWWNS